MSGVDIISALLRAYAPLLELVSEEKIKEGRLPAGIELPALLVTETSQVERQPLKRGQTVRTLDRVSVTGSFKSVRDRKVVMELVKQCCAGKVGEIGGGHAVSILTAGRGPDLNGPGDIFQKTQDFRVSYDA
ncbi:MAG TPA: hypothetical protein VF503_20630 [Sphingobium sp.]|uniref:hypothetical protein n=1 Tax=Sphingobium sp. TaxID=1912891 RepID=UPI002ED33BC2